jgi:hypothetical protein
MKNYIRYMTMLCLLFGAGCKEEEILTAKPGEPIDPVNNLEYAVSGNQALVTWDLPVTFSADIIKPVSVLVRISVDGQAGGTQVIANAPESFTYPSYDPAKKYKFTVKVQGAVDTKDPDRSKLRISLGKTVAF